MKPVTGFAAALLLILPLAGCSDLGTGPGKSNSPPAGVMRPLTATEKEIVSAGNTFGFSLFVSLNAAATGQNLFICPLSVSMALGMTLNGARGQTWDAMQSTLGFSGLSQAEINGSYFSLASLLTGLDPTVQMQIANSIWYRPVLVIQDAFRNANITYFNAQVNSIDFSSPTAPDAINGWVSDHTNGRITNIVQSPIPDDIVMYLINAVYFKGTWTYSFDPKNTTDDFFTASNGSRVPCKMMAQADTVPYFSLDGVQGIDLPYGSAGFSMTFILPPPGVDIDQFVSGLTQDRWNTWTGFLTKHAVTVYMPKFRLKWRESLRTVLSSLGMAIAFSGNADFTGIDSRGGLAISDVLHATFVQVDEEGTEAAGVTVVSFIATAVDPDRPAIMRLDRPFIYAIRERQSGTILFIGKLASPSWEQ